MIGRVSMLGLVVAVLIGSIAWYRHRYQGETGLATNNIQPASYWCTVVGVEGGTDIDQIRAQLLPPLHSSRLLAVRQVWSASPFVKGLDLVLPSILETVLIALYSSDPHLNWRQAHLLHQYYRQGKVARGLEVVLRCSLHRGPLGRDVVNLAFPALVCPSRLLITRQTPDEVVAGEDTLAILKPSLSQSDRTAIVGAIQATNLTLLSSWSLTLSDSQIDRFYEEHREQPFFPSLRQHMRSGSVQVLVLRGLDAVNRLRTLVGATDPALAAPGTIRSIYGIDKTVNAIHASDSPSAVVRELRILCSS